MYELRTAISYLIPRKGQLSISVVGLIAVFVITAITWLILVFFSTTEGIESRWSQKIVGIVGRMRVVPTPAYFDSPYYQLDLFSSSTNYTPQRLDKKIRAPSLPYDPSSDPPLPSPLNTWYASHIKEQNPVAALTQVFDKHHLPWRTFDSTVCHLSILALESSPNHSLSQYTCLLGLDAINPKTFIPVSEITAPEVERLLTLLATTPPKSLPPLKALCSSVSDLDVVISRNIEIEGLQISQGTRLKALITFSDSMPQLTLLRPNKKPIQIPITAAPLPISVVKASLVHPPLALTPPSTLTFTPSLGYPALFPKQMRQQGARLLDTGTFQFSGAGVHGTETLSIPFYVAGFFDSGILPIGGKLVITSQQAVLAIQPDLVPDGPYASSGIIIDVPQSYPLDSAQKTVQNAIDTIAPDLFTCQRFDQYEITSELYQQLASEKTLFRLLSIIIIAVACSNIFSMLFILAHDRRKEIAVLRALGAPTTSITAIFLIAGLGVGLVGSTLGAFLAALTLHYLPELLSIIGILQGHAVLQQAIYGDITAQTVSLSTLVFTYCAISLTSAIAGGLAAVRACRTNVSEALRS